MMSQHSQHSQTNGASLEDCHTNFFALTDLCGIKWRVYTWESAGDVEPLEDPVLLSYSRCLSADVLCVWRRTWQQSSSSGLDQALGGNPSTHTLPGGANSQYRHTVKQSPKELWVFWYGEEPDFSSLVSRELTKNEGNQQGSWDWETGLSYECRTILFKALHNLIERCLLTRGFIRLGKWFVQPYDGPEAAPTSKDTHLSFRLSFFVHGESTVCTSVDIRKHPPVRKLTKKHILTTQQSSHGVPVILAPYGMKGTLTGVTHRSSEPITQKLLEEWKHFFPIEAPKSPPPSGGTEAPIPNFVEVVVGGFKMRYPTCFVLVTDMDIDFYSLQNISTSSTYCQTPNPTPMSKGVKESSTPDNSASSSEEDSCHEPSRATSPVSSSFNASTHTLLTPEYLQKGGKGLGWGRERGEAVWQDIVKCPVSQQQPNHDGLTPDGILTPAELAGQWEFADPATKINCSCSKCKIGRDGGKSNTKNGRGVEKGCVGIAGNGGGGAATHLGRFTDPPFHWRSTQTPPPPTFQDSLLAGDACGLEDSELFQMTARVCGGNNLSGGFGGYKGMSIATPGSVPSLRMTGVPDGPPASVESPVSVTPSPLPTPRTPHSQPASVTAHHDLTMPMLSPHQPPSNTSMGDPTTPAAADSVDTKNNILDLIGPKSVSSLNQSMSPYPGSVEGPKPIISGDCISNENPTSMGNLNNTATSNFSGLRDSLSPMSYGLRKPLLPGSEYEKHSDGESPLTIVYDSSKLHAWLHHPVKKFRPAESKVENPLWPPYRPFHIAQKFEIRAKDIKIEIKSELEINEIGSTMRNCGVKRQADPYDFENEATGVTLDGFKIKEEKDDIKAPSSVKSTTDPLSPSKKMSNLYTLEGLVPKASDLDDIFDSPVDDYAVQTPPGSNKPLNGLDDTTTLITSKLNCTNSANTKNGSSNIAELSTLAKMYPTPPSLEHNPDHDTVLEDTPINIKQEPLDEPYPPFQELNYMTKEEHLTIEYPLVYKPPPVAHFIGSDRYKPLVDLPSNVDKELLNLPSDLVYNPSWQQFPSSGEKTSHSHLHPSQHTHPHAPMINNSQSIPTSLGTPVHSVIPGPPSGPLKVGMSPISPATSVIGDGPLSQRGPGSVGRPMSVGPPVNYELPSPASNQSSYLNKTLPSVESAPLPSIQVPEANSLMTNIVLQDSCINLFRDHNFESCTMCVCNNNSQKVLGNIKGSDGTIYLPPSHLSPEEEYISCNCGFSAVVNRRLAFQSGLFYEDEVDLTGLHEDLLTEKKRPSIQSLIDIKNGDDRDLSSLDIVPPFIFEMVQSQSLVTLCTPSSVLYRAVSVNQPSRRDYINLVNFKDGNEKACLALEQARTNPSPLQEWDSHPTQPRQCVMHKWCYFQFDGPACSQDMVRCMKALQPYLQEAIQKKRSTRLWEPVYNVSGPLTWRQFHRMAVRGTEDMAEPLPIPLLLAGHDKDWLSIAPQSIRHWEKLLLEPYTQPRNIAYVIVSPDNEFVLKHVRSFFKELSSMYELCRLGRHAPIRRVLRDGIMRVSKRAAGKVANEALDDWFTLLGDSQVFTKLRMYSQICCHTLAPHLTTLSMDKTLFEAGHGRTNEPKQAPSPMPPPSSMSGENANSNSVCNSTNPQSMNDGDNCQPAPTPPMSGATPAGFGPGSSLVEVDEDESPPPAIMVYLVDPFTVGQDQPELHRLITLGLLRCFKAMLDRLPESMQSHIYVQIVSLESILELAREPHDKSRKIDLLKSLAFSVFMQCRRVLTHSSSVKSLTGFGPASVFDSFLRPPTQVEKSLNPYPVFSPAYILAPVKESRSRHKEAEEALGDPREKSTVLFITYCLTEDQRWLIASATDELGEILETVTINVEVPNRTRRKKASSRRHGLKKLMDWILGVMSIGAHPWRLVVGRLGRIGHGELKGWLSLMSRKSLAMASKNLKEMCKQCSYPGMAPCILSACLVSLEPDSSFRMMPDMFTPDERFGQNSQNCNLSTPQDVSCTHILVFPTSATAQSAQQRFQDEPTFNGLTFDGGDDLFLEDEVDDMGGGIGMGGMGINFNDILSMETAPTQEMDTMEDGSGAPESTSQPGSPTSQGINGRCSPSQYSGQARSNGVIMVDPHEDTGGSALQQQPLALGYFVSTSSTGKLPRWFWSSCPHLENVCPTFLKSALHLNQPAVTQAEDYMHNAITKVHPLDSTCTADVLRFVLEGYNSLSWLVLDPSTQDRRSCLPLHMQVLSHLYNLMASII